jgi:hypothetical protein
MDYKLNNCYFNLILEGTATTNPTDPVISWPSGVPQGMSIVGTGLAVFSVLTKLGNCSPRLRVLDALGATGVTATTITYHYAIENPIGFNRFIYSFSQYRATGNWPSLDSIKQELTDNKLEEYVKNAIEKSESTKIEALVSEVNRRI